MLLALGKHFALYVFPSVKDAELHFEAIDVHQDALEFCDTQGQRYSPTYTIPPKHYRFGIDIGAFKLVAVDGVDPELPKRFIERAAQIGHSSIPVISSIEALRDELHKRA